MYMYVTVENYTSWTVGGGIPRMMGLLCRVWDDDNGPVMPDLG